jgi:hypothetical protein
MTVAALTTATDDAIADAAKEIAAAEEQAQAPSVLDNVSRLAIGVAVVLVWGVAVLAFGAWLLNKSPEFVCSQPGDSSAAGYAGECTNGWSTAIEQGKDLVSTFVLPVLTLVLGYYFGIRTGAQDDE